MIYEYNLDELKIKRNTDCSYCGNPDGPKNGAEFCDDKCRILFDQREMV